MPCSLHDDFTASLGGIKVKYNFAVPKDTVVILDAVDSNQAISIRETFTESMMRGLARDMEVKLLADWLREFSSAPYIPPQGFRSTAIPQPTEKKMNTSILDKAAATVNSDRQGEYGDPVENWVATAIVTTVTQRKPITPEDVVQVMCAAKGVRAGRTHKEDTNIDSAGYAEIRERVQKAFRDGTVQKIVEKLLGGWVKFDTQVPKPVANAQLANVTCRNHGLGGPSFQAEFALYGSANDIFEAGFPDYRARYLITKVK